MLRKIKPLEWNKPERSGSGGCYAGKVKVCELSMSYDGEFKVYYRIPKNGAIVRYFRNWDKLKAAVEQAFVKWLDTFSEEVGE